MGKTILKKSHMAPLKQTNSSIQNIRFLKDKHIYLKKGKIKWKNIVIGWEVEVAEIERKRMLMDKWLYFRTS